MSISWGEDNEEQSKEGGGIGEGSKLLKIIAASHV
jgi:hypothetical protein